MPDVKALKAAATEVRARWKAMQAGASVWPPNALTVEGAALLSLVDALPSDAVIIERGVLERLCDAAEIIADCPDYPERAEVLRKRSAVVRAALKEDKHGSR
jgi:hypothetical protein